MATGYEWGPETRREIGGISPEGVDVDLRAGTLAFGINVPPVGLTRNWATALIEVIAETDLPFSVEIPHEGNQIFVSDVRIGEDEIVATWTMVKDLIERANERYVQLRERRNNALELLERAGTRVGGMRPAHTPRSEL